MVARNLYTSDDDRSLWRLKCFTRDGHYLAYQWDVFNCKKHLVTTGRQDAIQQTLYIWLI